MKIFLEIWKDKSGGISTIFGAASALFSIGSSLGLFGGKKKSAELIPLPPTIEPVISDPGTEPRQAQDRSRRRRAASVGRRATILTSPLGLAGDEDVARPSLLGQ